MNKAHSKLVVRVALPVPLPQLFDYLPEAPGQCAPAGVRVVVPFGPRKLVGIVVESGVPSSMESGRLLAVEAVLDGGRPLLDPGLMNLLAWCWQYYKHAPGEVLQTALPPALRKAAGGLPDEPLQYSLTDAGRLRLGQEPGRARAQYAMLQRLESSPVLEMHLASEGPRWRATLARLLEQAWVEAGPAAPQQANIEAGPRLNAGQQEALDGFVRDSGRFQCHLLDGVTGSGKTEVYLHMLERVLTQGRQGLVLVPEIGLTPQLLRRFRRRLGLEPAVIHSRVSQGERLEAWEAARSGRARLVIGTRSA